MIIVQYFHNFGLTILHDYQSTLMIIDDACKSSPWNDGGILWLWILHPIIFHGKKLPLPEILW